MTYNETSSLLALSQPSEVADGCPRDKTSEAWCSPPMRLVTSQSSTLWEDQIWSGLHFLLSQLLVTTLWAHYEMYQPSINEKPYVLRPESKINKYILAVSFRIQFLGAFTKLSKAIFSFFMRFRLSVRMEQLGTTGRILTKFDIEDFSKICRESWIKRDQLDVTCFIISLFNAQHVSDVNTSILRSLRLICWVISWVVLLWFDVYWCYVVVWLGWCGIRMH